MGWTLLFAQDPVSGIAGWTSFGLAGLVLSWLLLRHLPEKDRQLDRLMEVHRNELKDTRTEFQATLQVVLQRCERESCKLIDVFKAEINRVIEEGRHRERA